MTIPDHSVLAVNKPLTPRRRRRRPARYTETSAFLAMLGRLVRRAGERVEEGDLDELRDLMAVESVLQLAISRAIQGLRDSGTTWQELGEVMQMTRQGAEQYASRLARKQED
jgi:hypothetical protein